MGRTYDGLILAELIDGGRQRETDREGQALTVNHHSKHGLHSHTTCIKVGEQTLNSQVLSTVIISMYSVCHANILLFCILHYGFVMRGVITKVGRGEGRQSLHSHPQSCCPAPGALSGAPPPENVAPRSAAGLIWETDEDGEAKG